MSLYVYCIGGSRDGRQRGRGMQFFLGGGGCHALRLITNNACI